MKNSHLLLVPFLFLALAPASRSVTIADNGPPDQVDARVSDPSFSTPFQQGDEFTLATTATAGQIQWWGGYFPSNTPTAADNFTIRFFDFTAPGVPATVPLFSYVVGDVGKVDIGPNFNFGPDIYLYSATIPDTTLVAGTYLLSIVNDTAADTDDDWVWATSSQSGISWFRNLDGQAWNITGDQLAFKINSPAGVPDTGTSVLLLGVGFIAIWVFRRGLRGGGERRRLRTERSEIARLNHSNLLRAIDG